MKLSDIAATQVQVPLKNENDVPCLFRSASGILCLEGRNKCFDFSQGHAAKAAMAVRSVAAPVPNRATVVGFHSQPMHVFTSL